MEITKVTQIQVGGGALIDNLEEACIEYLRMIHAEEPYRAKICFVIKSKDGVKQITIRDEDAETVAYGDFKELSSFMEYAKEKTENS